VRFTLGFAVGFWAWFWQLVFGFGRSLLPLLLGEFGLEFDFQITKLPAYPITKFPGRNGIAASKNETKLPYSRA